MPQKKFNNFLTNLSILKTPFISPPVTPLSDKVSSQPDRVPAGLKPAHVPEPGRVSFPPLLFQAALPPQGKSGQHRELPSDV